MDEERRRTLAAYEKVLLLQAERKAVAQARRLQTVERAVAGATLDSAATLLTSDVDAARRVYLQLTVSQPREPAVWLALARLDAGE